MPARCVVQLLIFITMVMCTHSTSTAHTTVFLHGVNGHAGDFTTFISRMRKHFGPEVLFACLVGGWRWEGVL